MRLITAHKILIGSAIAFFLFFALLELRSYAAGGGIGELATAIFALVVAVGFAIYLRGVFATQRRDAPP